MLQVNLNTSTHHSRKYWSIESSGINKLKILVNYLNKYPLMTSKLNDYQDWRTAYYLMVEKAHLTGEGKEKIVLLKSKMNKQLNCFDWNHLL